jgi:PAS domain S-box-containing protein
MKPGRINNEPAFPVMAMDILSNVLSRADHPANLGTYLTEEIRDLTGARCVLLIQCLGDATVTAHRVVSVNPLRRREWTELPAVNRLYEVVHRMPAARFWRGDEPSEVAGLLHREGFELSMAFPLNAGVFRVGAMLVLGLPDEEHISSVLDLLNNLSAIVALVLRNSFLFERQEEIIQERTAELRAGEEKYRTLIESANDAVFIHEIMENGVPGPFIEVNELACNRLGYSREELAGMTPMELDDPRYRDRIAPAMERLLKEGHAVFETAQMAKDGRSIPVEVSTRVLELKGKRLLFSIVRDITERKRAEEERLAHLRLFESMDRVNRAMQGTTSLEQMMSDVLDVVLSIFDCDRAFLFYPCDPEASAWSIPMERTKPEYPGALAFGLVVPMDEEVSGQLKTLLKSDGPVKFGVGTEHLLPTEVSERFRFKSLMSIALYPKVGKPWHFGLHQCSYARVWTPEEERLLQEIGRRLEDGLTSLLAHRDLRESNARYRRIVDTATEGIWVVGQDALTTFVNSHMAEMLGCSGEEMIGRPLTDFMFEEDAPDHLRKMENRRQGISESYERRFRRQDGQTVWTHVSATPLFDAEHHFTGSFAMFTDITERKRAEEALLLSQFCIDQARIGIFQNDETGAILNVNKHACESLGYSREELCALNVFDIDPEITREKIMKLVDVMNEMGSATQETTHRRRDGTTFPVEITGNLIEFHGKVSIFSFVKDITTRKEAEEEIRRLKNYLANIIDSMPSVLVGMDRNEIVTQWNREAEEISGIPATEAVGRPITELLPDFSPWIEAMRNEIEQQRPTTMEKLLIEKEGERRFYDLMLYPIIANGTEGAVIRIEDATERARIQELMIQTEKMMSVGGLAAGMAHEINNPLGIITQAAQNIERRVSPELPANRKAAEELGVSLEGINAYFEKRQIPEFIGSIRTAGFRAAKIVANMLQFSRCAGTTMQSVSLDGIIEQALELAASDYDLKKKFDFRSIEIIRDYAPDMPEVPMVVVEIEQVMLNLLKNAAQAITLNQPGRGPRITLRLRREERYAVIEVEDNGPGMKEEVRRRAFEPFFTTKEPGLGTGLGLSVSYMIVTQNHKGLMEVESKLGKGACFRVRLPLSKESIHG